jgi:hypothetical protein
MAADLCQRQADLAVQAPDLIAAIAVALPGGVGLGDVIEIVVDLGHCAFSVSIFSQPGSSPPAT